MGGMAAARQADEIGHVSVWARLARVGLRLASGMVETLLVAGVVALAAGVSVATMGCGAILACGLLAGFIGGATGWSDYKEKKIQEMTEDIGDLDITGTLGIRGAATVRINGRAAMRAVADAAVCRDHGQPNPNFIAEGSDSVFIETYPAARKGDKMMCAAQIASGSDDVLVGGNKTAYLEIADDRAWWETALEIGVGLAMGRGNFLGKVGCLALGAVVGMAGDALGRGFRALIGYPVHPATGGKVLDGSQDTDFVLPGPLGIAWRRFYSSHDHREGSLHGAGWSVPYEIELHVERPGAGAPPSRITYVNPQGRHIGLPDVEPGTALFNVGEGFTLGCTAGGHYEVGELDHVAYQFGPAPQEAGTHVLKLLRIRDRFGHWVGLRYDGERRLAGIADHLGRLLRLDYEPGSRRVVAIHLVQAAPGEQLGLLATYRYDAGGQLTQVQDRTRATVRRFAYAEGLMVRQEDAAGFACHYAWEDAAQASGPERQDGARGPDGRPLRDRRVVRHWTEDGENYAIAYGFDGGFDSGPASEAGGWTSATDQLGREERWQWDRWHNLTAYTNALGATWRLVWNERRELLSCTRPSGASTTFQYDDNGMQTGVVDPLGRLTRTLWDSRWFEPLRTTGPDGATWRYEYDRQGLLVQETAPDGGVTRYAYDAQGQVVQIEDALGGARTLQWNERGLLVRYTDCSGRTTRYGWDGWGQLQSVTDALGQQTQGVVDARGLLRSLRLPDGSSQGFEYDAGGRLVEHTDALSRGTRYGYNARGQLLWRRDAQGREIGAAHDGAHRLSALATENGGVYRFRYDDADRLVEEERLDGTRVGLEYDADGHVVAVVHHPARGDDVFHELETQAQDGTLREGPAARNAQVPRRTELQRDALGRLVQKRVGASVLRYRYDAGGRLVEASRWRRQAGEQAETPAGAEAETDNAPLELQHTTRFEYDALGRIVAEHAQDAASGQVHTLRHEHDALGNRTRTQLPAVVSRAGQAVLRRSLNYLHYGSGHLHQINLGLAEERAQEASPEAPQQGLTGEAGQGDALAGVLPEPVREVHRLIADIERDALHREVLRTQGTLSTRYALDALGRRTGSWTRSGLGLQDAAGEDWRGAWQQQVEALAQRGPSAAVGLLKQYRYDAVGELRESVHSHKGRTSWRYDATGRVEQALRAGPGAQPGAGVQGRSEEVFRYDPAGNLLDASLASRMAANDGGPGGSGTGSTGYLRDNLVRVYEDKRFAYDGFARLREKRIGRHTVQRFEWDDEDQLVAVETTRHPGTAQATRQRVEFRYDALGRRIAKQDAFGRTEFIWEGMRLIEERRGSKVVSYVYEPGSYVPLARIDADGQRLEGSGHGGLVGSAGADAAGPAGTRGPPGSQSSRHAALNPMAAPGSSAAAHAASASAQGPAHAHAQTPSEPRLRASAQVSYFHNDPSGLPEEVTDEAGEVRWRASWRTWGSALEERWEAVRIDGSAIPAVQQRHRDEDTLEQNLRLQGQYLDRETGLHYNTFRYYDPDVGRFISPDPIGLAGGLNLQHYAVNPLSWIDPLGHEKYVIIGEGQSGVNEYARIMSENPKLKGHEFRTIQGDWNPMMKKSGASRLEFGSAEWERKAIQVNIDWIKDRHAEGYKFIDIGEDSSPNRSSFYKAEKETLSALGVKPMKGNSTHIAAARAAAKPSGRPPSKTGC
ncbi:RHS repeat-associated core domain protein [Paracidovorax avenae ATCC 19860]|uniref:RHS repeat-associated core domain protein n=2 Tax=Paracidovorax avenae TaxID=80867 RepID=F0QD69_PARA1|nr:RHS repeat-associated core domain-containing protein [Paracidovorax avenae]ADX46313.1 RHS repeat-associated core domain protein [Paracidovorax avenae ATCC 19860]